MIIRSLEQWEKYLHKCVEVKPYNTDSLKGNTDYSIGNLQKRNHIFLREERRQPTPAEITVGCWLAVLQIPFIYQKGFLKPFHRIVDFYLPKGKIIIEVDGKIHDKLKRKDKVKDITFLRDRRFRTLRYKNQEVEEWTSRIPLKHDIEELVNKLKFK